jgi:hypothetical protein
MAAIQSYYSGSVINKIEIFEMKKNKLEKYEGIPTSSRVTPEQTLKTISYFYAAGVRCGHFRVVHAPPRERPLLAESSPTN